MFRLRFFIIFVFVAIAAALQVASPSVAGFAGDFTLAALVVGAFFLSVGEVAVLALAGLFLLNWHPGVGREELFLFAFSVLCALLRSRLPFEPRLASVAAIAIGVAAFYILEQGAGLFRGIGTLLNDMLASVVFGAVAFQILYGLYKSERRKSFGFRRGIFTS